MTDAPDLELVDDRMVLRFVGPTELSKVGYRVTEAIVVARERGVTKLLVSTAAAVLDQQVTVLESYLRVREWARTSNGAVRMAMILSPWRGAGVEPRRFGITVAANAGLSLEIFDTETDAVGWLNRGRAS